MAEKVDQDVRDLIGRIRRRPNDAPLPAEYLLDEAADALGGAFNAGRQQGLREAAEVVTSMCTRTFAQDDAYTKLFEASEAITALMEGEGKK